MLSNHTIEAMRPSAGEATPSSLAIACSLPTVAGTRYASPMRFESQVHVPSTDAPAAINRLGSQKWEGASRLT